MNAGSLNRFAIILSHVALVSFFLGHSVNVQLPASAGNAELVVEGRVLNVFRSASSSQEFLVQILVQNSAAKQLDRLNRSTRYPAPGEYLYVHVDTGRRNSERDDLGTSSLPRPNMYIRAMLRAGDHQDWASASPNWFEATEVESEPVVVNRAEYDLGIETESVFVSSRRALKVTRVDSNGPAAEAGLEVGDILVTANGVKVGNQEQLVEQLNKSDGRLMLTVRDVRTGKDTPVEVKWTPAMRGNTPGRNLANRNLGVKTEVAFFNGNAALKVVDVADGSPAQRAGIVAGEIILAGNDNPLPKPADLINAERLSNGILNLRVVEPKTRAERDVRVDLR